MCRAKRGWMNLTSRQGPWEIRQTTDMTEINKQKLGQQIGDLTDCQGLLRGVAELVRSAD